MRTMCLLALLWVLGTATAGAHPYLAEESVVIGEARSLPWNGETDFGLVADYDVKTRLVPDTLALLSATTTPLVRFETLRRAALYLSPRFCTPEVALPLRVRLARRLRERVDTPGAPPRLLALARFDAGTFEALCAKDRTLTSGRAGYSLASLALPDLPEASAEVAYVLCRLAPPGTPTEGHGSAALAGCREGSPLARNLLRDFQHEFETLDALRADLGQTTDGREMVPGFPQPPAVPGADPDVRHEVVLLAPAAISVREADDGARVVGWVRANPVPVRLAVGHRMVIGTRIDEGVWVGEERIPAHDTETLLGGEPMGAVDGASFLRDLPEASDGGPVTLRAKVQVFETDIPPQHMGSPTGGRYRVLWERTYEVRLP
jgi:hypothetical protein